MRVNFTKKAPGKGAFFNYPSCYLFFPGEYKRRVILATWLLLVLIELPVIRFEGVVFDSGSLTSIEAGTGEFF
jgi:hypothetical protein